MKINAPLCVLVEPYQTLCAIIGEIPLYFIFNGKPAWCPFNSKMTYHKLGIRKVYLRLSIKSQEGVDYAIFIMAEGGC